MALVCIDEKKMEESGGSFVKDKYHVPTGTHIARLVSYVELGKHTPTFNGQPAKYDTGKKAGQFKPAEHVISLIFEFSGVQHSEEYPHTFTVSQPMFNGGFMNKMAVSDAFVNNELSLAFSNKTKYKKFLDAMNTHYGLGISGLHQAVGNAFAVQVQTKAVKKVDGAKDIKCIDAEVPGFDPSNPEVSIDGYSYYVDIKPESIVPMKQNIMGTEIDLSSKVVEQEGTYCKVFDLEAPTPEDWKLLRNSHKKAIIGAIVGSNDAVLSMLHSTPELTAEMATLVESSSKADEQAVSPAPGVPATVTYAPSTEEVAPAPPV